MQGRSSRHRADPRAPGPDLPQRCAPVRPTQPWAPPHLCQVLPFVFDCVFSHPSLGAGPTYRPWLLLAPEPKSRWPAVGTFMPALTILCQPFVFCSVTPSVREGMRGAGDEPCLQPLRPAPAPGTVAPGRTQVGMAPPGVPSVLPSGFLWRLVGWPLSPLCPSQ